jgi:hypothetical protein
MKFEHDTAAKRRRLRAVLVLPSKSKECLLNHHADWHIKQANNVLPKMHFSTSIQHVISTKTGAGIDSLLEAGMAHK